jgi:hypothetical protein
MRRSFAVLGLAALLTAGSVGVSGPALAAGNFNDEYVYAATRSVSDMDAHPGLKITLYPVTLAVDTAFLPLAVIAGFVTG